MLDIDRREQPTPVQRLERGRWHCRQCDTAHGWPFVLGAGAPDLWPHGQAHAPNSALRLDGDFLSKDFCVLAGRYFMVRAVLAIPVIGLADPFHFACWTTLSRTHFEEYVAAFVSGSHEEEGLWSGWLCNRLLGYGEGSELPAVWVQPRASIPRQRPLLWLQDGSHPLGLAQDSGISAERVLEILAAYGHAPG